MKSFYAENNSNKLKLRFGVLFINLFAILLSCYCLLITCDTMLTDHIKMEIV